jgi:hypothetical protein
MSQLRSLFAFLAVFMSSHVFAQYQAVLKSDVFTILSRPVYVLSFEHAINQKFSAVLSLEGGRYRYDMNPHVYGVYKAKGAGIAIEGRYYPLPRQQAPSGLFVSAGCRYLSFKEGFYNSYFSPKVSGGIMSTGLAAGYKYVYKRFAAEFLVGQNWGTTWSNDSAFRDSFIHDSYLQLLRHDATFIRGELSIGYAFNTFAGTK